MQTEGGSSTHVQNISMTHYADANADQNRYGVNTDMHNTISYVISGRVMLSRSPNRPDLKRRPCIQSTLEQITDAIVSTVVACTTTHVRHPCCDIRDIREHLFAITFSSCGLDVSHFHGSSPANCIVIVVIRCPMSLHAPSRVAAETATDASSTKLKRYTLL